MYSLEERRVSCLLQVPFGWGDPSWGCWEGWGPPVSCPSPHSWSRFLGDLFLQERQIVLAAPSSACPVLVPVRFLCASRPCSFVHWLEQGLEARTGSWGCRCRSGNDLKGLPWEEGCGKGSMPGKGPRSMCLGAGLAQVDCRCLCSWPDEGRLPLILLGMLGISLWPLCLGTASSTCGALE